jgi:hypothetical protein
MTCKRWLLLVMVLVLLVVSVAGIVGWTTYQRLRAEYDAYRALIQPGIRVAGVPVGGLTGEEARARVAAQVAAPYFRDFSLSYADETMTLAPGNDLGLEIPVDEMVNEAVASSHGYDYWEGFKLWVQGETISQEMNVPLKMTFDQNAAGQYLADVAGRLDITPVEPMLDVQALTFHPGRPGRRLNTASSAQEINQRVPDPEQRIVALEVSVIEPDQSSARIESMLTTLVPVMERAPLPPTYYTATLPLSTTGGLAATPLVSYTGELTWTYPHFISYTGHLSTTYAYFFQPGEPGYTFELDKATSQVESALEAGITTPITFEPDLVPAPPISPKLLIPPLEQRLAQFPGITSILVKNLDTGEEIYESHSDYVLSGMSIVKIGIMLEVYRHFGGSVDELTHQELVDMLGSESCNPCANRLLAAVGGGSPNAGAERVTASMRLLGLEHFYLCGPFRVVEMWDDGGAIVLTANAGSPLAQSETPGYDRCVRTTPKEMASLVEMIYACTEDRGKLREIWPEITPQACQEMVDIMAANDLRNMLGAGIPDEITMAHKHGFSGYDVPWGDTRGEVGIIYSPGATWLISFYIWEDTPWINWGINQPLYRDVSNMLYNFFNPDAPYWPRPPWVEPPAEEETSDAEA